MRILAAVISLGRFVIGAVFIANPKIMDQAWIGKQAKLPGPQLLSRAVGARDLTLGAGGLQAAIRNDGSAQQWLAAAAVCDAVDFGATYTAGRGIPRSARSAVLAIAAGGSRAIGDRGGRDRQVAARGAAPDRPRLHRGRRAD